MMRKGARSICFGAGGESAFVVMGTGRGKSLIFQIHAAREALLNGGASVFVYPLRALIADQACHAACLFESFGLSAASLTGESSSDERAEVYAGLASGAIDVVCLIRSEYLRLHADEIASCGRVRFLAVDEAHHLADGGGRRRDAYAQLGELARRLGVKTVLAATATASSQVANQVREGLGCIFCAMRHVRDNLLLDDHRNARDKETYLTNIVATGEKTIVCELAHHVIDTRARTARSHPRRHANRLLQRWAFA